MFIKKCIYGANIKKVVTPIVVRDAIVNCFIQAHDQLDIDIKEYSSIDSKNMKSIKEINAINLIKKFFEESEGDYEKPTRESIMGVLKKLKEFSMNFRNKKLVEQHENEIMALVKQLK